MRGSRGHKPKAAPARPPGKAGAAKNGDAAARVYLVGAGPGDPELITLKAQRVLARADAVLYDELANPELLKLTPAGCEHCYVGKRARHHALAQAEIEEWVVSRARQGRTVVRLKGGDPLVFGRGGEEIAALARAGIAWEVIPGVSAAMAAAAEAAIPLTQRGIASGVRFVAGHRTLAARPAPGAETLVVFMAAGRVAESADELLAQGWPPSTPAAVLERATLPGGRSIVSRLDRIGARARRAGVQTPALVIVGKVAGLPAQWRRRLQASTGQQSARKKETSSAPPGLILMAHGSPLPAWQQGVDRLARELAAPGQFSRAAYLPPVKPGLETVVREAARAGVRRLVVIPYFLAAGLHLTRDIPTLVAAERKRHPGLDIRVSECLDGHPALRTAVLDLSARPFRQS